MRTRKLRRLLVGALGAGTIGLAPAPATSAPSSCYDGVRSGPESDIDCGGDCPRCARDRACRKSTDCASGRCADGECVERPHRAGEPVPRGYRVVRSQTDAPATARVAGLWFLGVGYAAAYASALVLPGRLGANYVPIVGPLLARRSRDHGAWGESLLVGDAALQAAGGALLLGGWIGAGAALEREGPAPAGAPRVQVGAHAGAGRWQLGLRGWF
ncbi:MAG: hypothetical protein IT376_19685 [Polyangiaceae bacterium]|nr:hypothetical protein [Polyangiaceae bacterium]